MVSSPLVSEDKQPARLPIREVELSWRSSLRLYAAMLAVAFILRFGLVLLLDTYHFSRDFKNFEFGIETGSIAASIARGQGFSSPFAAPTGPTTWIAPLYVYLCAAVFKLFGVFSNASALVLYALNCIFAGLNCILIVEVGKRTVGLRAAIWAGWAWAVVPIFMEMPVTRIWDMSFSALLLSMVFLFALELEKESRVKNWAAFGAFWGLTALTNPSLLTLLPFSLAWPAAQLRSRSQKYIGQVAVALLACFLVISPWMARNYLVFHKLVFIRGNFGYEFRLGNFHYSNGMGWSGMHPALNKREFDKYAQWGETKFIAHYTREALDFVRERPGEFLQLTGQRTLDFWDGRWVEYNQRNPKWIDYKLRPPWPRYIYFSTSLVALWGLLLMLGNRVKGGWLFAALIFYPAAYYLTYPHGRYRHAIEPEMAILMTYFVYELAQAMRERLQAESPD